ncbi:hypothetical protein niasHS_013205 [Heterodera schachtii]|uniref:Calponin-homology (CH) domain-containing protein n=1 Tax=Heterodera schachtii TaxID=97005 RepID=A0ABD2II87_HETSC
MDESERKEQKRIGGLGKREQKLENNGGKRHKGGNSELIPIYTEWANRLLLAANLPPLTDLSGELCMPHKLIALIHSITFEFQKVPKEKLVALLSDDDPLISIKRSLAYLQQIGVPEIDSVQPKDIRNGHLGVILFLLYHLSCHHSVCQHRLVQQRAAVDQQKRLANHQQRVLLINSSPIRPIGRLSAAFSAHSSPFAVHRPRSNCATTLSSHSSGYSSTCQTTASSSTTPSSNRNNSNRRKEKETEEEEEGEEQEKKDQQQPKSSHREKRHQQQLETHYHSTVADALANKSAGRKMPPDSSVAPTEGIEKGDGGEEAKQRLISGNTRITRIAASPHRSALRVPQISSVSSKRCSIISTRPPSEAAQPKAVGTNGSRLVPPAASRRSTTAQSANGSTDDPIGGVDFVSPTLIASRICPQFSTVLPPARRHLRAPEGINKRSSISRNNEQNDDGKRGETPEGTPVEAPIPRNSFLPYQRDLSVPPSALQQFEPQKSILRQPSTVKGRSKSAALRAPISSSISSSRPINEQNEQSPKQSDQCPSSSSLPQPLQQQSNHQTSPPSDALPATLSSLPILSSLPPISASSSHRNSQLRLPFVTKPAPPKRHCSTVIRTSAESKETEEAEKEEREMRLLFGGREKERKKETISVPIPLIGPLSSPAADQSDIMPTPPKAKDGTQHQQQKQQNGDSSSKPNHNSTNKKATPVSKSLLLAPSSSANRRATSVTTVGTFQSMSGRVGTQCQQQRQQMQMSVTSNCSDCSVRSGETAAAKRSTTNGRTGGRSQSKQQQMNTSQSSSSSTGGRIKTAAQVKKPCQPPLQLMTTSSSSLCSGIKTAASGRTANYSDKKFSSIASEKKATAQQQLEMKAVKKEEKEEEEEEEKLQKTAKERGNQAANSPLMTEKKPIMAVKGISVLPGGTPPPAQKGGPSQSGGGRPLSADSDSESAKSSSMVGESRRNHHTVVGVVSPMQHQQETTLEGTVRANCTEDGGEAAENDQPIGEKRHKERTSENEEPISVENPHDQSKKGNSKTTETPSPTPLFPNESPQKMSKLAKSVPTKRLIIPTLVTQKSPGRAKQGKEEDSCKVPTAEKCRGEECPSPSVPPPMAPTKLMSVLREEQASPCPSSSLSTPAEETISRFHFDSREIPTAQRHQNDCPSVENQCRKFPVGALIAASDASKRKQCKNEDDQLGELFGDCATIGGDRAAKAEEGEEKDKLMTKGRKKEERMEEKWEKRETEERKRKARGRECPGGRETDAKQQLQQQLAQEARNGAENGTRGGTTCRGTMPFDQRKKDPSDYASESELDYRRQPMAAHLHARNIISGGDKLMMALDLRGTYGGKAMPAGRRKSRFRESYEDSSSLSSGLSETFDDDISTDDLTGSSSDYLLVSPDKMRQFAPPQNGQKHFEPFQKTNGAHQQNNSMVSVAERERQSAGQLLQKCQSAQRGCAYFGSALPGNGQPIDPHRPSTSNGCFSSPSVGHFVPNSAEGRRSGFDQHHQQQKQRHDQSQLCQQQQKQPLACQRHPNEQLFALRQQQRQQQNQQQQQQQQLDFFRPYHTIAAADWLPLQYQQQLNRAQRPTDARRVLSPPHNLMVLSDDGDTLSVAAGEVGGTTRGTPGATALHGAQAMATNHFHNDSLPRRHPAYHTHSLDRHAHLRVLSAGARPPPPAAADDPSAHQQHFTTSATAASVSRNLPHQRLQLNSLLISPRHHYSVNGYSAFAHPPNGNAAISTNFHRRSRGGDIYSNCFSSVDGPLLPPLGHYAAPPPPPGSSARSSFVSCTAAHQRSASLSAMSRSMVTVLEQHEERQRRRGSVEGHEAQQRVLEYVRALAALNGTNPSNNNNINNNRSDCAIDPFSVAHHKSAKRLHTQPPLPIPPRSPHLIRRTPLSLPRQLELNNNHASAVGTLSARGHADPRIYSNLKCATSSNGVSSPTRPSAVAQPGSQLSLASSVGSAYSTIEERYEWEIGKLQNELEAYRTHVQLLSQKNSGFNCVIQMFDNRLQSIMTALAKLQQKQNVKRDEVEKLCNEIEQLRAMSVKAGVTPYWNGEGAHQGTVAKGGKEEEQPQQNGRGSKKSWIRSSFSRAFHKGNKKGKQQQQKDNNNDAADNNSLNSFSSFAHSNPSKSANAISSSSSVSVTSKMDTASRTQLGELSQVEMALLQRELDNRELALTDVQLDALDKAKEIDILRETVNRLQHENKLLKYNYFLLERKVRSESRTSSHLSLNTTGIAGGGALEFDSAAQDEVLAEASEQLAPPYEFAASSPSSGDISVNTTTTGSNNSAGGATPFIPPPADLAATKSVNRCSFASSTTTSSKRSSHGALSTVLPSAKVVLCVDLSGRVDSLSHAVPPVPSHSLCPISRANSGSSSTLSSQASSSFGSVLSGAAKTGGSAARRELTIGYLPLPIGPTTNWKDLDQQLGLMLEEYLHRIDPDLSLGIDSYSSIIGYQIHPTQQQSDLGRHSDIFLNRRKACVAEMEERQNQSGDNCAELDEVLPILSPSEALQPGTLIRIRLRGVAQHSVDALVLESLFPRHLLEQLLYQLEQHRRLLLFGPTGIGKSNLARLLAKYLLMQHERNNINNNNSSNISNALVDIRFPMENNSSGGGEREESQQNQQKVQQVKEHLITALRPASNTAVLMMDNLQWKRLGIVLEAFNSSCVVGEDALSPAGPSSDGSTNASPFVICTLNRTCVDQSPVQQLQLHHNFRLFALSYKMDAVSGYLGRYLRRRLAEHELSSSVPPLCPPPPCPSPADPVESVLHFLGRSLRAINEFIERAATGGPDLTLGPRILLQCPLNSDEAQLWFVQLWNDKLVPYMRKVLAESKSLSVPSLEVGEGKACHLAKDPTDEIGTFWPWTSGKGQLLKICH